MTRPKIPDIDKFQAKVELIPFSECWWWTASLGIDGYGEFACSDSGKKLHRKAHRFSYEHYVSKIPEGLTIDHLCRNRACVRPDHLECVTNKVNVLRGFGPPANNARKTHCKSGHEFVPENLHLRPHGKECLTCKKIRAKRWHANKRTLNTTTEVTTK